jgi:hypothetical protein
VLRGRATRAPEKVATTGKDELGARVPAAGRAEATQEAATREAALQEAALQEALER